MESPKKLPAPWRVEWHCHMDSDVDEDRHGKPKEVTVAEDRSATLRLKLKASSGTSKAVYCSDCGVTVCDICEDAFCKSCKPDWAACCDECGFTACGDCKPTFQCDKCSPKQVTPMALD